MQPPHGPSFAVVASQTLPFAGFTATARAPGEVAIFSTSVRVAMSMTS